MKLSEENRKTLLLSIHQAIEEAANTSAEQIENGQLDQMIHYPPNGGLSEEEQQELRQLQGNDVLKSAIRKVIASSSANAFFVFLNYLDGTGDPDIASGEWSGVMLVDQSSDYEEDAMLHDEFYASYWDWRGMRNDRSWRLDMLD